MIYETDTNRLRMYDTIWAGWVIMAENPVTYNTFTVNNFTLGDGVRTGWYKRSDGFADVYLSVSMGASSAVTGAVSFAMPTFMDTQSGMWGRLQDASTGVIAPAWTIVNGPASFHPLTSVTQVNNSGVSSTVPWTWAIGDSLTIQARLKMANRTTP